MLKKEKELKNKPDDGNLPEEKYTVDRLIRIWRQYAFQVKDEGLDTFYNALVKRDPLIEKNDILKLFVETVFFQKEFYLPFYQGFLCLDKSLHSFDWLQI